MSMFNNLFVGARLRSWLAGSCVLILLVGSGYIASDRQATAESASVSPTERPKQAGKQIVAEAKATPVRNAALSFSAGGVLAEVLVQLGDHVVPGQTLVRLDATRALASMAQAQAELARAQAHYHELLAAPTAEELAAAEAQVRQAEAQLRVTKGDVTAADVRAAEAQLHQAHAQSARLQAGASNTDLRTAAASLEEAEANLASQRDSLSAAKTIAQLQVDRAAQALVQAQSSYATSKSNWEYVDQTGRDPATPSVPDPAHPGKTKPSKLNDVQRQQYYDAYVQAEAGMHSAESALQEAKVAYDSARQAEVSGVDMATQRVSSAQANLDKLRAGADADQVAAAQAQVASAQANLGKLRGDQRGGALDAAQSAVDLARSNLDTLRSGASKGALAVAQAQVQSAQAALDLAQAVWAETELKAPFAGVVASMSLRSGEYVTPGIPIIRLADLSAWQIETEDLSEVSVVGIHEGACATISSDAIPDLELTGRVSHIEAYGENKQGDTIYKVLITPDQQDERLRWNMTTSVTITTTP
jgi:HlyD family secretion protein